MLIYKKIMEFIIDNPTIPQRMFDGQPMNVYQNPQQSFNFFDTKNIVEVTSIVEMEKSN